MAVRSSVCSIEGRRLEALKVLFYDIFMLDMFTGTRERGAAI